MIVFRLKPSAFAQFLNGVAGIIKCRESVALNAGDEIKVVNAARPDDSPVFAKVQGRYYERHAGKLITCYVVE